MNMLSSEHLGPNLGLTTFTLVVKQSQCKKTSKAYIESSKTSHMFTKGINHLSRNKTENKLQNLQEEGTAMVMLHN